MNDVLELRRARNLSDLFLCLIHWWFLLGCFVFVWVVFLFLFWFLLIGLVLFFFTLYCFKKENLP